MINRALLVVLLTAFGLTLAGCGPCGFGFTGWDTPLSCRSDNIPQQK